MALFLIATRKAINTSGIVAKWSNRYFAECADVTEANNIGQYIWGAAEALFHNQLAFCYEIYVNNTQDPPNTPGTAFPVSTGVQRGLRPATAASIIGLLPLWNVVRVDQPVVASRPSRKFYRIPLLEADITNAQLDPDILTSVQTGANLLSISSYLRDIDGQNYAGGAVVRGLTARRLGRESALAVPPGPAFG